MSATIEARKLLAHFGECPVIEVPGRTFSVTIKYLEDVIEETGLILLYFLSPLHIFFNCSKFYVWILEYMIEEGDEYARKIDRKIKGID